MKLKLKPKGSPIFYGDRLEINIKRKYIDFSAVIDDAGNIFTIEKEKLKELLK